MLEELGTNVACIGFFVVNIDKALPMFCSKQWRFVASTISFCYIGVSKMLLHVLLHFASFSDSRENAAKWCLHFWKNYTEKKLFRIFLQQWSGSSHACESNMAAKLRDVSATLTPSARTTVSKVLVCDNCRSRPLFSIHKYKSVYYVCKVRIPTYWELAKKKLWGACYRKTYGRQPYFQIKVERLDNIKHEPLHAK